MRFLLSFYSHPPRTATLLYVTGAVTVLCEMIWLIMTKEKRLPIYISLIVTLVLCALIIFLTIRYIPYGEAKSRPGIKRFIFMRLFGNMITVLLINTACAVGFCFTLVFIIGGFLFKLEAAYARIIMRSILFVLFFLILSTLIGHNGNTDTNNKVYNPHLMFFSHLLSMLLLMPFMYYEWSSDFYITTDFMMNPLVLPSDFDFIRRLGNAGFVIGYFIIYILTLLFSCWRYTAGRGQFFKKYPGESDYDKKECDSIKAESSADNKFLM